MIRNRGKYLLDFVPILILAIYGIRLVWLLWTSGIQIEWNNITGFILLPLNICLLIWRHQVGVLSLGLLLFMGLFGAVSFIPGVTTFGMGLEKGGTKTSFDIYGNPIYLLFLLVHFILSGRYYVGIVTKKYWQTLFHLSTEHQNK